MVYATRPLQQTRPLQSRESSPANRVTDGWHIYDREPLGDCVSHPEPRGANTMSPAPPEFARKAHACYHIPAIGAIYIACADRALCVSAVDAVRCARPFSSVSPV